MTANVMEENKVVTVGDPAWHNLGYNFKEGISANGAHDAMGGSFELRNLPVGVMFNDGVFTSIPKSYAIVRGPTKNDPSTPVFGYVTDHYHIIQPKEIIDAFDARVGVSISSMGFIGEGQKMFICWNMPKLEITEGDDVQLYGSVLFGFDSVFSCRLNISTVRIVCENTWVANLFEAAEEKKQNRGRGTIYSGKHTNKSLLTELSAWMGHIQHNAEKESGLVSGFFKKLVETRLYSEKQAQDLIYTAFPDPKPVGDVPSELRKKSEEKVEEAAEKAEAIRVGIWDVFSTERGIAIDQGNYWGLFNSCTQYFNHEQKSKKDTAFSIVWGNRSTAMNTFARVLQKDIYG